MVFSIVIELCCFIAQYLKSKFSVTRFTLILPLLHTAPAATYIFAAGLTVDWSIIHEKEGITSQ